MQENLVDNHILSPKMPEPHVMLGEWNNGSSWIWRAIIMLKSFLVFTAEDNEVVRKKLHMAANSEISIPV